MIFQENIPVCPLLWWQCASSQSNIAQCPEQFAGELSVRLVVAFYFILLRDISAETLTDLLTNTIRDKQNRPDPINRNINNLHPVTQIFLSSSLYDTLRIISLHNIVELNIPAAVHLLSTQSQYYCWIISEAISKFAWESLVWNIKNQTSELLTAAMGHYWVLTVLPIAPETQGEKISFKTQFQ